MMPIAASVQHLAVPDVCFVSEKYSKRFICVGKRIKISCFKQPIYKTSKKNSTSSEFIVALA